VVRDVVGVVPGSVCFVIGAFLYGLVAFDLACFDVLFYWCTFLTCACVRYLATIFVPPPPQCELFRARVCEARKVRLRVLVSMSSCVGRVG